MPDWYVRLPSFLDPIAFSVGSFHVRWYALMYFVGFWVVWFLLVWRVRQQETDVDLDTMWNVVIAAFLGVIVGGRLGSIFLYGQGEISLSRILQAFSPRDPLTGQWIGWYGMSFFGALVGAVILGWVVARWKRVSFLKIADFVIVAVPLGYVFGRIGNFLNGELFGRETTSVFGMMVNGVIRHPSQLYEAVLEGVVLFVVLWSIRNRVFFSGAMLSFFGMGYAMARFVAEYFRNELSYCSFLGWEITQGQLYASILFVTSIIFYWWRKRKCDKINTCGKDENL